MFLYSKLDIKYDKPIGEYWVGKIKEEITFDSLLSNEFTKKNDEAISYLTQTKNYNINNIYPVSVRDIWDLYVSDHDEKYNDVTFKIFTIFIFIKKIDLITPSLINSNMILKLIIHTNFLIENNRSNDYTKWFNYKLQVILDKVSEPKIYDLRYNQHPLLKTKLKEYQRDGIQRMYDIEQYPITIKIDDDKFIKLSNGIIYKYNANKFIEEIDIPEYKLRGGILMDDVGIGKTIQALCLCLTEPILPTLILVPNHLLSQWFSEINKHFGVTQLSNVTIMSFDDWFQNPINNFDRLIIDEGHELTTESYRDNWNKLICFNPKHKWLLTATPFINTESLYNIIQFLVGKNFYDNKIGHNINIYPQLAKVFLRKIKQNLTELDLPSINIIDTFIKFSKIERNILDAEMSASREHINIQNLRRLCVDAQLNLEVTNDTKITTQELQIAYMDKYKTEYLNVNLKLIEAEQKKLEIIEEIEKIEKTLPFNSIRFKELEFNLEHKNQQIIDLTKIVHSKKSVYERYKQNIEVISKSIKKDEDTMDVDGEDHEKNDGCAICLGPYDDIIAYYTHCGHFYCKICNDDMIKSQKTNIKCPSCRSEHKIADIKIVTNEVIITISSKFAEIIKTINSIKDKVIVFTQFSKIIDKLKHIFLRHDISSITYNELKSNQYAKVIILSSIDNASGLDLSYINNVIIVEPFEDYLFGKEIEKQIIGRVHRINQTKLVTVYRMIIKDTIEEDIYSRQK
jgi:SNF2 family DNA or RNA helicase